MYSMWSKWLGERFAPLASPTAFAARDAPSLSVELLDVLGDLAGSQPAADISRLSAVVKAKSAQIDTLSDP